MDRVAVFGNAGGGKSTLARHLADFTGLPLYAVDVMQFRRGGGRVPHDDYLRQHAELIARDRWIIDGFGCVPSVRERLAAADTLVHVDLPVATHYRWVLKRFLKGLVVRPEGWPEDSPMWRSTLDGLRVVGLCDRQLTPRYRQWVAEAAATRRVHSLRSPRDIRAFVDRVRRECAST